MPINISELDIVESEGEPESDLSAQVAELRKQVQALVISHRELIGYCQSLEEACRASFADCPGVSPFPHISMSP